MRRVSTLCVVVFGLAAPLIVSTACNQSSRPSPEAAPSDAVGDQPGGGDTSGSSETAGGDEGGSTPGEVGLPPASASAWNNAESDGKSPTTDRGIKDYQAIIAANREKFRDCYEASLSKHPGIRGNVTIKFLLDPKGNVKEAELDKSASDITHKDLEDCMVARVKSLGFPPSKRGMESTVRYPFNFNPKQ